MPAAKYYIYVPLPAGLSRRVSAVGRRYASDARSAPHLTLVLPRTLATGRRERQLVRALLSSVSALSPFVITYRGVSYFGDRDFIYASVRRARALVACHDACLRAVAPLLDPSDRHLTFARPHITLAGRLAPEDRDRAWRVLRLKRFEGQFVCRELLLWRMRAGETRWRLVSRIPLGGPH